MQIIVKLQIAFMLGCFCFSLPAMAQSNCDVSRQMYDVDTIQPAAEAKLTAEEKEVGKLVNLDDCGPAQSLMFFRDYNAIHEAQPIQSLSELNGAWISDDHFVHASGLQVFGIELLAFDELPDYDNFLAYQQYWIVKHTPDGILWTSDEQYDGWVSQGLLYDDRDGYRYSEHTIHDYAGVSKVDFSGKIFAFERSHDLTIKNKLNHFERSVKFSIAGDTLVVAANRDYRYQSDGEVISTYSSVNKADIDLAFAMLTASESRINRVVCLMRELTDANSGIYEDFTSTEFEKISEFAYQMTDLMQKHREIINRTPAFSNERSQERLKQIQAGINSLQESETKGLLESLLENRCVY